MTTTKQYDKLNRLTSISTAVSGTGAPQTPASFGYDYNNANQRTRVTLADGSYWLYTYDDLGQVTSGRKYWSDGTPVPGQQFIYSFDTIGNRLSTSVGGSRTGDPVRTASYTRDYLNQLRARTTSPSPTYVDILGVANPTADVRVSIHLGTEYTAYRKGEYYHHALLMPSGSAQYPQVDVKSLYGAGVLQQGNIFVPPTSENFTPDADGNTVLDARWQYEWDGENRLVKIVSVAGPAQIVRFDYDFQGRRIRKRVWNGTDDAVPPSAEQRFIYDGWNLIATLNPQLSPLNQFVWGPDLSASMQGAGGVGGLLKVSYAGGDYFTAFDGNGNVARLVSTADRSWAAKYEYGPFGELIRITGPMAKNNPFRFSTKYQDEESDLLYYGFRYYNASTGRWLNRDPILERGGPNVYALCDNTALNGTDALGLVNTHDACPCPARTLNNRKNVVLSFHGNILDPATAASAWYAPGAAFSQGDTIHVGVTGGDSLSDIKRQVEMGLGREGCIQSITISAHGFGGAFGTWGKLNNEDSDDTAISYLDLQNKESEASRLFTYFGSRMCTNNCGLVLKACSQASDNGPELMKKLALYLNAPVVGWDDVYAVVPYGDQYTACPDGSFKRTDDGEPYAGTLTEFFWDKRWKNKRDKDYWKQARERLK